MSNKEKEIGHFGFDLLLHYLTTLYCIAIFDSRSCYILPDCFAPTIYIMEYIITQLYGQRVALGERAG